MGNERVQDILNTIKRIKESNLSVNKYFETKKVPFSRVQYYNYRKIIKKHGEEGLRDKREDGNYKKLTQSIKDYIIIITKNDPIISTMDLRSRIQEEYKITISKSSLNDFRKSKELTRKIPDKIEEYKPRRSGGGEIITGLAFFSGIIKLFTEIIMERVNEVRQSETFLKNKNKRKDHPGFRLKGRFTKEYNQLKTVRENRFKSIDEKIPKKNYASMNIFQMSEKVMSRYNLALLCLPLVTSNGRSSRINRVRGNDLSFLCGYNYKDAALDKYLQELKYLKVSEKLVAETAKFWMRFWHDQDEGEAFFVCYYIDGNTKALWSAKRHYKGKVTMIGRVMNCLENVFIHDGKGHPLYFQTFHGHADLGKHALRMITELTKHIDDNFSVKRILVMDGAGNSVKTMRGFHDSDEYFITILDKNQVKERRFKHTGKGKKYKYGKAILFDSQIELKDSSEIDYIYESRAVIVKWDNGRQSVLLTDIPCELLDASEITKRYFDRWPMQEKRFRDAKSIVNIHRIVGYGKRSENYEKMKEKHKKINKTIRQLKLKLKKPLIDIEKIEKKLVKLYSQENKLREESSIKSGKRVLCDDRLDALKQCKKIINSYLRQQKAIEKQNKEDFKKLKENMREEERIHLKDKVYRIDTELDQIMTCFKLSFANLCSLFLSECMNHEKLEMQTLFDSIFQLYGDAIISDKEKIIKIIKNPKESKLMNKLEPAMVKLNGMKMINLDGRQMKFSM
jgi:transposase